MNGITKLTIAQTSHRGQPEAPLDRTMVYISEVATEFAKDLPGSPSPMLTYRATSSIPCSSDKATLEIKVWAG